LQEKIVSKMLFLNENEVAGLFPVKKYFSLAATSLCF